MDILIFDDHRIFGQSFKMFLEEELIDNTVFFSSSNIKITHEIKNHSPQIIFSDFIVPDVDVADLFKKWKAKNNLLKIIVLSSITNANLISKLLKGGADAFLSKSVEIEEVKFCIQEIFQDRCYICRDYRNEVMDFLLNRKNALFTPRELEVIQLIKEGKSIKEKAVLLFLSDKTIIVHRRNIMYKANVKSVTELLAKIDTLI